MDSNYNKIDNGDILVSIGVLTYNSEKTVIETLDSILIQTYKRIEVIISDDGSTDNTLKICSDWVNKNSIHFERAAILTVSANTGTAANFNRFLKTSNGDWIIDIAGDDIFFPDAINNYIEYSKKHPNAQWIQAKAHSYLDSFIKEKMLVEKDFQLYTDKWKQFFNLEAHEQFMIQINCNMLAPPNYMIRRKTLVTLGGIEEKYGIIEDAPLNFMLLKNGIRCYLLDSFTRGYRIGSTNVCSNHDRIFNIRHLQISFQIKKDYCWEYMKVSRRYYERMVLTISYLFDSLNLNNKNKFCKKIYQASLKMVRLVLNIKSNYR